MWWTPSPGLSGKSCDNAVGPRRHRRAQVRTVGIWKNPPVGLVNWFEIPVVDFERAMAFYEHVFEVELERAVIDGHPMAIFPETDEPGRANGALAVGDSYVPSVGAGSPDAV